MAVCKGLVIVFIMAVWEYRNHQTKPKLFIEINNLTK